MKNESVYDMLKPKMKGMIKPSKKICNFLKPSKMTKEGRTIITKRCTAYIPNFEVKDDREICENCSVPDMFVRDDRCKYFTPLDIKDEVTRWRCVKTGKKFLEPDQCAANQCDDYEKTEKMRWEIGRLEKTSETDDEKKIPEKQTGVNMESEGKVTSDEKRAEKPARLIPKTNIKVTKKENR